VLGFAAGALVLLTGLASGEELFDRLGWRYPPARVTLPVAPARATTPSASAPSSAPAESPSNPDGTWKHKPTAFPGGPAPKASTPAPAPALPPASDLFERAGPTPRAPLRAWNGAGRPEE
jgi:hypothetical protein